MFCIFFCNCPKEWNAIRFFNWRNGSGGEKRKRKKKKKHSQVNFDLGGIGKHTLSVFKIPQTQKKFPNMKITKSFAKPASFVAAPAPFESASLAAAAAMQTDEELQQRCKRMRRDLMQKTRFFRSYSLVSC